MMPRMNESYVRFKSTIAIDTTHNKYPILMATSVFVSNITAVMADINKPISITDEVLKEGSGVVRKRVSESY